MKTFVFIFLSLLSSIIFAQEPVIPSSKFTFGISFSPDYAYRTLSASGDAKDIAASRDSYEDPKLGFTTGIRGFYVLHPKWRLELGLLYSDKGEKVDFQHYVAIDPRRGFVSGDNTTISLVHRYHYVDVPLKANYMIPYKRMKIFFSGGLTTNIFAQHITVSEVETSDGSIDKNQSEGEKLSSIGLSANLGFGLEMKLSTKFQLRLEPEFRHSITPINDSDIRQYQYSFGSNIGICFNI